MCPIACSLKEEEIKTENKAEMYVSFGSINSRNNEIHPVECFKVLKCLYSNFELFKADFDPIFFRSPKLFYLLFSSGFGFDCFLRDIMLYTKKTHLNIELKCG